MTESTTPPTKPLNSPKTDESATNASENKGATKKVATKKVVHQKPPASTSSSKISKLAIFAVLVALATPAAHYYWQQLQNQQLTQTLAKQISDENNAALGRYQSQMQQALTKQQQNFNQQLQQVITKINSTSQAKITELDTSVTQLEQSIKQRQPSDWLLHEAEYLIRIATRTLWLEHDTKAAIGLLKDADTRLTELNNPAFLPVREVIHQDIESLVLMPTLQTDEIVLTLMTMGKQIAQLPLAIVDLANENDNKADLALTNDISDWQTNLAKTWQKFFNDFIRIRKRTGSVDPLMSPEQQTHLKQNLSLKIQLALWAASERKGDIYQKSLAEIQQWLNEYFDMSDKANQHFINTLQDLEKKQVNYNYPKELSALKAIRVTIRNEQNNVAISVTKTTDNVAEKITEKPQGKDAEAIKIVPMKPEQKKAEPQTKKQLDQTKSEGSL